MKASTILAAVSCALNKTSFIDGRVSLSLIGNPGSEEVELAYQLLNPAPHFQEVVDIARSVILAGGTMSPVRKLLFIGHRDQT
jgi:chromosome transmission fidelity protein 1